MRTGIGAVLLLLIVSPPVWAGSDVVGMPSEVIIQSVEIDSKAKNVARRTHLAQSEKPALYKYDWISPDRKKSIIDTGNGYILHPHNISISKYHMGYDSYAWDKSSRYLICNKIEPDKITYTVLDTNDPKGVWAKDILVIKDIFGQYSFLDMNTRSKELLFKVQEKKNKVGPYALISVSMTSLKRRVLYRSENKIEFASTAPDGRTILFGTAKGIYLSRNGKALKKLFEFPGYCLTNLEWSPNGLQLLLSLRGTFQCEKYGKLEGIVLVNFNEKTPKRFLEKLAPRGRFHTLWFSRTGKRFGFAKQSGLWVRQSHQIGKAPQELIPIKPDLPIKGFTFNPRGTQVAVTAGPELWIYDLKKKRSKVHFQFGEPLRNFIARPHWIGDKITVSHIADPSFP
ncbi:MAG: hypothetical protein P1V97_35495 [Planctomycetota bacterium]|nr:hypothetical protein [Planctomycetota bacterium]